MELQFKPAGAQHCRIHLPGSKSLSNRYLIILALSDSYCNLQGLSEARDTRLLQNALQNEGKEKYFADGATPFRFFLAYAAALNQTCILKGTDGLHQRNIAPMVNALSQLGADIQYLDQPEHPPVALQSGIKEFKNVAIDRSISSQFVSAIMLVAPHFKGNKTIELLGMPTSGNAYINMTAACMKTCGIEINFSEKSIQILDGKYHMPLSLDIEADWSSAAWFYAIVATQPGLSISLPGLHLTSPQGDSNTPSFFKTLGVTTLVENDELIVINTGEIQSDLVFNLRENIDLAPALVATCAYLNIPAQFEGLENLVHKESNRSEALRINLSVLGYDFIKEKEYWILQKKEDEKIEDPITIKTFSDHRIAMAFSIFAQRYTLNIDDAECVEKSFPGFWDQLQKCNFVATWPTTP